jgi:hypothetical protein
MTEKEKSPEREHLHLNHDDLKSIRESLPLSFPEFLLPRL